MSSDTSRDASPWNLSPDKGVTALSRALFEDPYYSYSNPMHHSTTYQYPDEISNTPDTLPSPPQSTDSTYPFNIYNSGFVSQDMPFGSLPLRYYTPSDPRGSPTQDATRETLPSFFQISHYDTSHQQPFPLPAIVPTRTTSHYRITKLSTIPTTATPMKCHWPGCRYAGSFSKKGQLTRHVNTQHIAPKSFECSEPGCGKAFHRKDNLGEHIRRIHLGRYSQPLAMGSHS